MARQHFTLDEASRLLPWLREQFELIATCRRRMAELEQEVGDLARHRQRNGASNIGSLMHGMREEIRQASGQVQAAVTAMERRGILVRDLQRGLVDFPALRDGKEVYLCWLLEEDTIGHWHPTDTGLSARQPL